MEFYDLRPRLSGRWSSWGPHFFTIKIEAKKIEKQSAYGRGSNAIKTGSGNTTWLFASPEEINEPINHNWEPYESVASRLANKVTEVRKGLTDLSAMAGGATSAFKSISSGSGGNNALVGAANSAVAGASNVRIPEFKVDTSLTYKDTERRKFDFEFQLVDLNGNPYDNIIKPIRKLEELSCAEMTDNLTGINFPNIFKVTSEQSELIKLNHAAIESILPVWKGPYINDYPTQCSVTISFIDIEPLYRRSFSQGGIIRTS